MNERTSVIQLPMLYMLTSVCIKRQVNIYRCAFLGTDFSIQFVQLCCNASYSGFRLDVHTYAAIPNDFTGDTERVKCSPYDRKIMVTD